MSGYKPEELSGKVQWHLFSDREVCDRVDAGLRHKTGVQPHQYLAHWLSIARDFAYATHDGSWGEFEKSFAIIIRRLVSAERELEILKRTIPASPKVKP